MGNREREYDRLRNERNRKLGLVKVAGYWVHRTHKVDLQKKIRRLMTSRDYTKAKEN